MEYQIIPLGSKKLLECLPDGGKISDEPSTLDLIALCGEEETDSILFYETNFTEDFFDLKTGLAGKVLLKLSNYRIKAAAVIPPEIVGSGRFYEMVLETNRRNDFRVYPNRDDALEWIGRA
jgi:PadR family transcriptional regulator, regulatory protein AphA